MKKVIGMSVAAMGIVLAASLQNDLAAQEANPPTAIKIHREKLRGEEVSNNQIKGGGR